MPAAIDTMAYVKAGGVPWHGLGEQIIPGMSIEDVRRKSGLVWEPVLSPVMYDVKMTDGNTRRFKMRDSVMFRNDTLAPLDIVGPNYVPTLNGQVLDFFREYVEAGDAHIETIGSLDGGRWIWALAKMDKFFELRRTKKDENVDRVEGYVLLANPHLYGKGMVLKFTSVRVVCMNTLTMALSGGSEIKLWHNAEFSEARRQEAKRRLGIARDRMEAFHEDADTLMRIALPREDAIKVLAEVFDGKKDEVLEKQPRTIQRIVTLFEGDGRGANLATAKGTAWGLLNAVTEYHDWEYGQSANNRITNAWLGNGEAKKRKVMSTLLEMSRN